MVAHCWCPRNHSFVASSAVARVGCQASAMRVRLAAESGYGIVGASWPSCAKKRHPPDELTLDDAASRNSLAPKLLDIHVQRMTFRIVRDRSLPDVSIALVENGRLEAVGKD